jgi:hypothetical protein
MPGDARPRVFDSTQGHAPLADTLDPVNADGRAFPPRSIVSLVGKVTHRRRSKSAPDPEPGHPGYLNPPSPCRPRDGVVHREPISPPLRRAHPLDLCARFFDPAM